MSTAHQALLVVAAVFWGAVTSSIGRYNPFSTSALFVRYPIEFRLKAGRRWRDATLIANLLPIFWLGGIWWVMPEVDGVLGLVAGAFAGMFPVALPRLIHGFLASEERWRRYYEEFEWREVIKSWDPLEADHDFPGYNRMNSHVVPGILYLMVPPAVGLGVAYLAACL